jgi:hypothetical protein
LLRSAWDLVKSCLVFIGSIAKAGGILDLPLLVVGKYAVTIYTFAVSVRRTRAIAFDSVTDPPHYRQKRGGRFDFFHLFYLVGVESRLVLDQGRQAGNFALTKPAFSGIILTESA